MNKEEKAITEDLTEKQKIFCREYILHWNGTKAAIKAGYSEDCAAVQASENLRKPNIQTYIAYLKANLAEVAEISPLMVLNEYKKIAFSSIAHLHLTWIERKEFDTLTDEQKECIQEIDTKIIRKVFKEFNEASGEFEPVDYDIEYVKIKLYDKLKGLEGINKMLGYDAPSKVDLSTLGKELPASNQLDYSKLSDATLRDIANATRPEKGKD